MVPFYDFTVTPNFDFSKKEVGVVSMATLKGLVDVEL